MMNNQIADVRFTEKLTLNAFQHNYRKKSESTKYIFVNQDFMPIDEPLAQVWI